MQYFNYRIGHTDKQHKKKYTKIQQKQNTKKISLEKLSNREKEHNTRKEKKSNTNIKSIKLI